jgi:hypothetical protein
MDTLFEDLLFGAGPIAKEVRGKDTKKNRRWVYHRHRNKQLPTWNEGNQIVSRKSLLREHYTPKIDTAE